jgi:hypothetical protein
METMRFACLCVRELCEHCYSSGGHWQGNWCVLREIITPPACRSSGLALPWYVLKQRITLLSQPLIC